MKTLQRALLRWYRAHGRETLPWRIVRDPYFTLVSEFMLQQTQVDRVVPKFERFVERWPTLPDLASAKTSDVLRMWQGLGYNSRATRLHAAAVASVARHGGKLPKDEAQLRALPGIGPYTARAILAFGYDAPCAPVDTNVRRIVHRLFYGLEVPDPVEARAIDEAAERLVPRRSAHDWNSALMDLGSAVCTARAPKCLICPVREWCAAAPVDGAALESLRRSASMPRRGAVPFRETARFARGRIVDRLRMLDPGERISLLDLYSELGSDLKERPLNEVRELVSRLERDGLVQSDGDLLALKD